jgi:methanogenic corrinoid protein MtbC1
MPEHVLEQLVHYVLSDDAAAGRALVHAALAAGADPQRLLADVLWPAAECVHQLCHDRLISPRVFNTATRALATLAACAAARLPACPPAAGGARPRVLIAAAPGERTDLGAHLLATLAEGYGMGVLFAGANLSTEDLTVAVLRLQPDAVLLHGSLPASAPATAALLRHLRRARLWPDAQLAVVGGVVAAGSTAAPGGAAAHEPLGADLESAHPVEILELLALCPEYRAPDSAPTSSSALHLLPGATPTVGLDPAALHDFLCRHFPPRTHTN